MSAFLDSTGELNLKLLSLRDLAKYGKLGEVCLNMHASRVEELIGKADFNGGGSGKHMWENLWRYGDIELGFERHSKLLIHIAINFWGTHTEPEQGINLRYDPWIFRGGLEIDEFVNVCGEENIGIREFVPTLNDDCREFLTEGGMHVIFQNGDEKGLEKLIVSEHEEA